MTSIFLPEDVAKDEGYAKARPDGCCEAYPDPKSGGAPWTIGYGTCGHDIQPGTVWTQAQAYGRMMEKLAAAKADLDHALPWWRQLNSPRQDALANMTYNLGLTRLLGFKKALAAMERQDWTTAAAEMLDSQWEKDVGARAHRLARQMLTGARIAP